MRFPRPGRWAFALLHPPPTLMEGTVLFRGAPMRLAGAIHEDEERRSHPEWAGNDARWWADYREALKEIDG